MQRCIQAFDLLLGLGIDPLHLVVESLEQPQSFDDIVLYDKVLALHLSDGVPQLADLDSEQPSELVRIIHHVWVVCNLFFKRAELVLSRRYGSCLFDCGWCKSTLR